MRNVDRPKSKPQSLRDNHEDWTKNLIKKIQEKKVKKSDYNHYNQTDVKNALINMYNGCCCYCESRVDEIIDEDEEDGTKRYGHIEHLKPKTKFPESCFDWENLHLACPDCNLTKGTKYDHQEPILDPTKDIPITSNYSFDLVGTGLFFKSLTKRAATTEEHVGLNRRSLLVNRVEVFHYIFNVWTEWKKMTNVVEKETKIRQLEQLAKEDQYGSVISWALDKLFY